MESRGVSVQASRFALLRVDDDSDREDSISGGQRGQQGKGMQQAAQAKKKNKKKKKEASDVSEVWTHELYNPLQQKFRTIKNLIII